MTRTKINIDTQGDVAVTRINPMTGEGECTVYFVPSSGGYVRIRTRDGRNPQVCAGLSAIGDTLYVQDASRLLTVIRREHARRRREEARELLESS